MVSVAAAFMKRHTCNSSVFFTWSTTIPENRFAKALRFSGSDPGYFIRGQKWSKCLQTFFLGGGFNSPKRPQSREFLGEFMKQARRNFIEFSNGCENFSFSHSISTPAEQIDRTASFLYELMRS
jgi:hypothetical protein